MPSRETIFEEQKELRIEREIGILPVFHACNRSLVYCLHVENKIHPLFCNFYAARFRRFRETIRDNSRANSSADTGRPK